MKNRILSMILTIVVLIGMVPTMSLTAFAAETNVASVTIDGTTTNYTDLASAFTAARDATGTSVTLTLLEDVTTEESISATGGKFTFDLTGKATLDTTKTISSKRQAGADYGMIAWGGAAKEWFEQADAFDAACVGKTATEIAALAGSDNYGTDELKAAGCTILVNGMVKAAVKIG